MKNKKITYNLKTRQDLSNQYNGLTHSELLKLGNVDLFADGYNIEKLDNGRIVVKGLNSNSSKKK